MKADLSRNTFRPTQHYRDVLKQQGRVDVDADWNEQQAINVHRTETEAVDVIGRTGAPLHAAGFAITADGATLRIGAGRYYVDGILCENERDGLDYREQPDRLDTSAALEELRLGKASLGVVYLDVWLRHITALHDPLIREIALGGPDTATRTQVVWQVRVLPLPVRPRDTSELARLQARRAALQAQLAAVLAAGGDPTALVRELADVNARIAEIEGPAAGPVTCESSLPSWDALIAPAPARLAARTTPTPAVTDLCQLPPRAGYQRTENQLYRVEIHQGGGLNEATFKWSRDNGAVATAVENVAGLNVTVGSTGPDEVLGFAANHWVELLDDATELAGGPGQLLQIEQVPAGSRTITMRKTPPAVDAARRPLLRRWDQSGPGASEDGVAITGDWQPLEDGVEVRFTGGPFRPGDYWLIPARVATRDVEWPLAAADQQPEPRPPRGIEHHYSRLALVEIDGRALRITADCRKLFPPLTEISAPAPTEPPPPPAPPAAMKVKGTSWRNDAPLALAEFLERGLFIDLDRRPEPASVSLKTMIVTLELPIVPETGFEATASRELAPRLPVILFGEITVRENQVRWLPVRGSLESLSSFFRGLSQVLGRVTLKGAAIWSAEDDRPVHLDGVTLGEPAREPNAAPRTALNFPSGAGGRASDFESWFLLTLPIGVAGFTIAPLNVRLIARGNELAFASLEGAGEPVEVVGTITLSAPATADVVVALRVAENRELVELPESVTIPAGRVGTRFLIAPARRSPEGTARIPISAIAGGAELRAVLTIGRG